METAFRLARERSRELDAVGENKAAILALGTLLGHWRIEQPLGKLVDEPTLRTVTPAFRATTLRGRPDWTRHFTVSAAIVVLASEGISNAAGILKEEMDSQGGSGFSFGDLLADRAGTTFATIAIRDGVAAASMQERLSRGFQVDD